MSTSGIVGAENWARFHAENPGCGRLKELLAEYDRRGAELARLRVERKAAATGAACRGCGRPVAPCPAYPDYPRVCLPAVQPPDAAQEADGE
jgi:hypothetical protein